MVRWMRGSMLIVAAFGTLAAGEPGEWHGRHLGSHTGLRLVVADDPPFVLDVDNGSVTRLRGVGNTLSVISVSDGAVVMAAEPGTPATNLRLWAILGPGASPTPIGDGRDVVPASGNAGVWVTRIVRPRHCALMRIGLDGRRSAARAFPCAWVIAPAASLGLVVHRTRIIDPRTGRKVFGSREGVLAVAGRRLLLGAGIRYRAGFRLRVLNTAGGARRGFRWPSILADLETPQVDPRGRYVALPFADPRTISRAIRCLTSGCSTPSREG